MKPILTILLLCALSVSAMNIFNKPYVLTWDESDANATGYYLVTQPAGTTNLLYTYLDGFSNRTFAVNSPTVGTQYAVFATNSTTGEVSDFSNTFTNQTPSKPINFHKR